MFISTAHAQDVLGSLTGAGADGSPSMVSSLMPFLLVIGIFYFLMIRPQQKRYNTHKNMLSEISKGDKVVTGGGVVGKVLKVEDDFLQLEIAESVQVKVVRSTIGNVLESKALKAQADKEKAEKKAKEIADKKIANDN